jgi:hypothetical protein
MSVLYSTTAPAGTLGLPAGTQSSTEPPDLDTVGAARSLSHTDTLRPARSNGHLLQFAKMAIASWFRRRLSQIRVVDAGCRLLNRYGRDRPVDWLREDHFDTESALRPRPRSDGGAVGSGDGPDN